MESSTGSNKKKKKKPSLHLTYCKNRQEQERFHGKLPTYPPPSLQAFDFEKICRLEIVTNDHHRKEAAFHDIFRNGRPQKQYLQTLKTSSRTWNIGTSCSRRKLIQKITHDMASKLRLWYNTFLHYVNLYSWEEEARYVYNLEWLWGTFGPLNHHVFVAFFCSDRNARLTVMDHHDTYLSVKYFKIREVEDQEHGYIFFRELADPENPDHIKLVLSFDVSDSSWSRTKTISLW